MNRPKVDFATFDSRTIDTHGRFPMGMDEAMKWRTIGMLARSREARELVQHSSLYGENNEALLIETLRECLGRKWAVGSGEIIDCEGNRSPQCDIIIYDENGVPTAFRNRSGTVVVYAHAVGAVVEVKSRLHSSDEAQQLHRQLYNLDCFTKRALKQGNARLKNSEHWSDVVVSVFGFAYSATIQPPTIKTAIKTATEESPCKAQTFVLDAREGCEQAVTIEKPQEFEEIFDRERGPPNGWSFDVSLLGEEWVVQETNLSTKALHTLIKEILTAASSISPLRFLHTPGSASAVFDIYNPWADLYPEPVEA